MRVFLIHCVNELLVIMKVEVCMSWKDKTKEWGGGEIAFLSEDGEAICFIVVGEPVLLSGKFKGKLTVRVGAPIVSQDGFTLLIMGKRLARRLSKYEDDFESNAFIAVRRGAQNDINTTYELNLCKDEVISKELFDYKANVFKEPMIAEAVKDAEEVMKG